MESGWRVIWIDYLAFLFVILEVESQTRIDVQSISFVACRIKEETLCIALRVVIILNLVKIEIKDVFCTKGQL